jgi:hypothetical protein
MTHMQIYTEIKQNKKGIKMQDKTEVFNEILEKEKIFDGTVVPADVIVAIYNENKLYAIHKPETAIKKNGKLAVAPLPKWTGKNGDDIDNIKVHLTSNNEIPVGVYEEIVYTPDDITFITFVAKKAPKKSEAVIIPSSEDEYEKWEEESDDEVVQNTDTKIAVTEPKIKLEVLADKEAEEAQKEAEKKAAEEAEKKAAAAKKAAEEKEAAAKKEAEEAEKNILMQEYKVAKEALSAHLQETHKKTNIMQKELYNILYKLAPMYKPPVEGLKELNRSMDPKTTNSAFGVMRSDPENLPELERLHTMALIDMFDDNKPINNRNIPGKMEGYYKLWALDNEPKANAFKTAAEEWNGKHELDKATAKAKHAINAMPKVAEKTGTDIFASVFAVGSSIQKNKKPETQKGKTVEKRKTGSSKTAPVKKAKTGKGAKSKEDDSDDNIFLDPSDEGGEQDE